MNIAFLTRRFVLVFALSLSGTGMGTGCLAGEFTGDDGNIRFHSNLGAPWSSWTPDTPVAVGVRVRIEAVDVVARDPQTTTATPPRSTVEVDDSTAFGNVVTDVDLYEATAVDRGESTVRFAGFISDSFTLRTAPIAGARFIDPVRQAARRLNIVDADQLESGAFGPDIESPLVMTPGSRMTLGELLVDASGAELGTDGTLFGVTSNGSVATQTGPSAVTVTAPATAGEHGILTLSHAGLDVGILDVTAADPAGVSTIQLTRIDGLETGVKATVRLSSGQVLWQPPIVWELDPLFVQRSQAELGEQLTGEAFDPTRSDILLFERAPPADSGFIQGTITARIGTVSQSITVQLGTPPANPPPPQINPVAPSIFNCGDCSSTGPEVPLYLALAALLRRRRR